MGQQCKPYVFLNFYQLSVKPATQTFCVYKLCLLVYKTKEGNSETQMAIKEKL